VEWRFKLIRRTLESEYHRRCADALVRDGRQVFAAAAQRYGDEQERELEELDRLWRLVEASNEPEVLPEGRAEQLAAIAARTFPGLDHEPVPYLAPEELRFLNIRKGSLDEAERRTIESHAEQTYRFLSRIHWTDELRNVAGIARGHHEKLNGSGYPRGLRGGEIPLQTRILTIADIFDSLTSLDRPYKQAVSPQRALDILASEAAAGLLDPDVLQVMVESEVYRKVLETDWREL
jgi:hypothetical protein